jgi:glutaredoxin 3
MGTDPLIFFMNPACPYCRAVRAFLKTTEIPLVERDVTASPDAVEALVWASGSAIVPAVIAGGDVIVGCDFDRLSAAVQSWREAASSGL